MPSQQTTITNLVRAFLRQFKNPDDPILLTRRELGDYLKDFVEDYEEFKKQKKDAKLSNPMGKNLGINF